MGYPRGAWALRSTIPRPPLPKCVGYVVLIQSPDLDSTEGEGYVGVVMSVRRREKMLRIRYEPEENASVRGGDSLSSDRVEDIHYGSPRIAWLRYPVEIPQLVGVTRPSITTAVGWAVNYLSCDIALGTEEIYSGSVISVNETRRTVLILFEQNDQNSPRLLDGNSPRSSLAGGLALSPRPEDPDYQDIEEVAYDSKQIAWIAPPFNAPPRQLVQCPHRPQDAVGYKVHVRSREFIGVEGAAYVGKVIGYAGNNIRIQYGPRDSETLPLLSFDVAFVEKPFISRSVVPRPSHVELAKGYLVDTKCDHADADDDDVYVGKVIDVDKVKKTIRIRCEMRRRIGLFTPLRYRNFYLYLCPHLTSTPILPLPLPHLYPHFYHHTDSK